MCTIALLRAPAKGVSFVVAANRDERRDRPSRGPFVWNDGAFVAPRDEVHGGSWLGLTAKGLFVGVTNRAGTPRDPSRRSRGELVRLALEAGDLERATRDVRALPDDAFSPFHLVLAQRDEVRVLWSDGERLHDAEIDPSLVVVTEQSFRGEPPERERFVRETLPRGTDAAACFRALGVHGETPFSGTCVHFTFDDHGQRVEYGSRSSSVLVVREDLGASELHWIEGPPCTEPSHDLSALLAQLRA